MTKDTPVVRMGSLKIVSFGTNGMKIQMLILYLTSLSVAHSVQHKGSWRFINKGLGPIFKLGFLLNFGSIWFRKTKKFIAITVLAKLLHMLS
jgi:hypothetical protein